MACFNPHHIYLVLDFPSPSYNFSTPPILHHSTTATFFALLTKNIVTMQAEPRLSRQAHFAIKTTSWFLFLQKLQMAAAEPTSGVILAREDAAKRLSLATMRLNVLDPNGLEGFSLRVETLRRSELLVVLQLPLLPPRTLAGLTTLIATVATVRAH